MWREMGAGKSQKGDFQREERGVSNEIRPQSALSACHTWAFANFSPARIRLAFSFV